MLISYLHSSLLYIHLFNIRPEKPKLSNVPLLLVPLQEDMTKFRI